MAPLVVAAAGGCVSGELPPSAWPPPNFSLVVEELRFEGSSADVIRRMRVDAEGIVVYGTSSRPLVNEASGVSLPVFDRLAIYRLEPECVRALARRIDRLGVRDMGIEPSQPADQVGAIDSGIVLFWRAFAVERELPGKGRLRGPLAEIFAVVAAHLPAGEKFDTAIERPVVPVLRGVPEPRAGADGSLSAYRHLVERVPDDDALLLDGFALACSLGQRDEAEWWLSKWTEATASQRAERPAFADGQPRLDPEVLAGFLPPR